MIEFNKNDCAEIISPEENKKQLRRMLEDFTNYCDEHGIRYYLSGGTLLGAIRHKGFIPWDDDIDINIPRPDIEKLYKISNGKIKKYYFVKPGEKRYKINSQFYKIFNEEFLIEKTPGNAIKSKTIYYPISLDIFPIDGFPSSTKTSRRYCKQLIFLRKMLGVSWYKKPIGKNMATFLIHSIMFFPAKLVGEKNWSKLFQHYVKKYEFNNSDYIGVTSTVHYITKEKVPKKDYLKMVEVEFEGKLYHAPSNYDIYLSQLYGDYMKLPPVEKRVSEHNIMVYKRKE